MIDWKKFKIYLAEKYGVGKVFIFLGFIEENKSFYNFLAKIDYQLILKPTVIFGKNKVKGNCDAELVLHAMIEFPNYKKAVIVSGDGDFACLVDYLEGQNKLAKLLVPNRANFSSLLKKVLPNEKIAALHKLKKKIGRDERK